jgi:hypothetical protein
MAARAGALYVIACPKSPQPEKQSEVAVQASAQLEKAIGNVSPTAVQSEDLGEQRYDCTEHSI